VDRQLFELDDALELLGKERPPEPVGPHMRAVDPAADDPDAVESDPVGGLQGREAGRARVVDGEAPDVALRQQDLFQVQRTR